MSRPEMSISFSTQEEKEAWIAYFASRGFKHNSDSLFQCMVSYLRQRPPKAETWQHGILKKYLE